MAAPVNKTIQRYHERMQKVAVGAQLQRKGRVWTVTQQQRTETGVVLKLRHGSHGFRLYVPVTLDGPELWHTEFTSAALPPTQREMFARGAQ